MSPDSLWIEREDGSKRLDSVKLQNLREESGRQSNIEAATALVQLLEEEFRSFGTDSKHSMTVEESREAMRVLIALTKASRFLSLRRIGTSRGSGTTGGRTAATEAGRAPQHGSRTIRTSAATTRRPRGRHIQPSRDTWLGRWRTPLDPRDASTLSKPYLHPQSAGGLLKSELARLGVSCFVAHEDIEPSTEWQEEIMAAVFSMHALAGLLTSDSTQATGRIRKSVWALGAKSWSSP